MINYSKEDFIRVAKTDSDEFEKVLLKEFYELRTAINEAERERGNFKRELHKKKLQALKQGAQLWTCRSFTNLPYGSECRKISNGRLYMRVATGGVRWRIAYGALTDKQPDKAMTDINRKFANLTL